MGDKIMFCRFCGKSIPNGVKFCPECGNDMSIIEESSNTISNPIKIYYVSSKNRIIAILLCVLGFVGFAGIHRMYVGKWTTGALYAITFGLCMLGTGYDLYKLIYEEFKDGDGYPLFDSSSMAANYKKRIPKDDTHIAVKIIAYICLLLSFALIVNSCTSLKTKRIETESKKYITEKSTKEEKLKRKKIEQQQAEELLAKRKKFEATMSQYPCFSHSGQAGSEMQIIVNEQWSYMNDNEKKLFVVNTAQTISDCDLVGTIFFLSFRFKLDGKKLATFDGADGTRILR